MKKLGKLASLLLAVVMLFSLMSFASADEVPEGYPEIIKDADGKPVDLGGFELTVYDWWSSGTRQENPNAAVEAQYAFQDWCMETYNFKVTQNTIGDWASNLESFINFINAPDGRYYAWFLRPDVVAQPMSNNMFVDLASVDSIDLSAEQWNPVVQQFMTSGDSVYGTYNGKSQAREGLYFNYRLLEEAGIDPDDLYDMQADGTWTWDAFEEVLKQVARDVDNDGVTDIWGMANNMNDFYHIAVFSNGGKFFDRDENGKIVLAVNRDEALEALNWACDMRNKYQQPQPADNDQWNWFVDNFKTGNAAFLCYQEYAGFYTNSELSDMEDDYGFLAFPKGPKAENYATCVSDNVLVIPNVYTAEEAWKIGFVMSLYFAPTPGFEDADEGWIADRLACVRDERSVLDTLVLFRDPANQVSSLEGLLGSTNDVLGSGFFWDLAGSTPAELIESKMPAWQSYMDIANGVAIAE